MSGGAVASGIASVVLCTASPARAAVVLAASGVTSSMSSGNFGSLTNLINESGLTTTYTSGVTNFTSYINSNPTENGGGTSTFWDSNNGATTGNVDFNLGGPATINAMALWNRGGNANTNAIGITLLGDTTSAFSSPVTLGTYTANPNTGPTSAVLPDVFTFASVTESFVRMQITSNNGGSNVILDEAAFSAIPEPASLSLLAAGAATIIVRRRRA